jgi:hypothetical protein
LTTEGPTVNEPHRGKEKNRPAQNSAIITCSKNTLRHNSWHTGYLHACLSCCMKDNRRLSRHSRANAFDAIECITHPRSKARVFCHQLTTFCIVKQLSGQGLTTLHSVMQPCIQRYRQRGKHAAGRCAAQCITQQ